jgi:hydrogenase maturation protein HypF
LSKNTNNYVEIEGLRESKVNIDLFARRLLSDAPIEAHIDRLRVRFFDEKESMKSSRFYPALGRAAHLESIGRSTSRRAILVLRKRSDPNNRRYLYALNSCAHCGPRYSIIDSLPF